MEASQRESVTVIHRDSQGSPDYVFTLSFEYGEETHQWVGVCPELGTSAFANNLDQVRSELREAVELQLNELGRLTEIQDCFRPVRYGMWLAGHHSAGRGRCVDGGYVAHIRFELQGVGDFGVAGEHLGYAEDFSDS